jgi:hypothetical protein
MRGAVDVVAEHRVPTVFRIWVLQGVYTGAVGAVEEHRVPLFFSAEGGLGLGCVAGRLGCAVTYVVATMEPPL